MIVGQQLPSSLLVPPSLLLPPPLPVHWPRLCWLLSAPQFVNSSLVYFTLPRFLQSPAPSWQVDPLALPQSSEPWTTPLTLHLLLGSMLSQLHRGSLVIGLHRVPSSLLLCLHSSGFDSSLHPSVGLLLSSGSWSSVATPPFLWHLGLQWQRLRLSLSSSRLYL